MQKFSITQEQVQTIWNILMDMPTKNSLGIVDIIRNLPLIEEPTVENIPLEKVDG